MRGQLYYRISEGESLKALDCSHFFQMMKENLETKVNQKCALPSLLTYLVSSSPASIPQAKHHMYWEPLMCFDFTDAKEAPQPTNNTARPVY